jgi:hypothetical protein
VVDRETGVVLSSREKTAPIAGGKTLEGLFAALEEGQNRAEEVFEREKAAMRDRDRLLDAKFREALERAQADSTPPGPRRPFDFD